MKLLCFENSVMEDRATVIGQLAKVILVDDLGTAYLVVASPCSAHSTRQRAPDCTPPCDMQIQQFTPTHDSDVQMRVVTDVKRDESKKRAASDEAQLSKRQKHEMSHDKDVAAVERAVFERKTQLEKSAEQRAETVFKQWYKEKKTLEQAIDESLR